MQFPIVEPLKLDSKKTGMEGVVREVTEGSFSVRNSSPRVLIRTAMMSGMVAMRNLVGMGDAELVEKPSGAEASEIRQNLPGCPSLGMKARGTTLGGIGPDPTLVRRR
jgi:hypothetical protein